MAQKTPLEEEEDSRERLLWALILGFLLLVVNAALISFILVPAVAEWFGISPNGLVSRTSLFPFQYLILFSLVCFVVGILRGRATRKAGVAMRVGCYASAFSGFLAFCIWPMILLTAIDKDGGGIFSYALLALPFTVVLAGVAAGIGGLIGKYFWRQRPKPDVTLQPQ